MNFCGLPNMVFINFIYELIIKLKKKASKEALKVCVRFYLGYLINLKTK